MKSIYTLMFACLFMTSTSFAATYPVTKTADTSDGTCDADCSLREAILAANASDGVADEIIIPAGVYRLTVGEDCEDGSAEGDLDITDSLTLTGAGSDLTIIDGNMNDRVFDVRQSTTQAQIMVQIDDLTIRHGQLNDCGDAPAGGAGMRVGSGDDGNEVNTVINRVVILDNSSAVDGGGIQLSDDSTIMVDESTISTNTAAGNGGAIATNQGLQIVSIFNSVIDNNHSDENAGGIWNQADLAMLNVTVSHNSTLGAGGGLYNLALGEGYLRNVTITENIADSDGNDNGDGGGIFQDTIDSSLLIGNSIVAANTDGSLAMAGIPTVHPDCGVTGAPLGSEGYNLFGIDEGCMMVMVLGADDLIGTMAAPIDPGLFELGNYGGLTSTHALQTDSPAFESGDPNGCFEDGTGGATLLTRDQRDFNRPIDGDEDGDARCDRGAYERGICGDGFAEPDEECDDGNNDPDDGCSATCTEEFCGNGLIEGDEACDDGNAVEDDECTSACTVNGDSPDSVCGNGIVEAGEVCDDGNDVSGDGCSESCDEIDPGFQCVIAGQLCTENLILLLGDGGCNLNLTGAAKGSHTWFLWALLSMVAVYLSDHLLRHLLMSRRK